jgi:hypothetical protein
MWKMTSLQEWRSWASRFYFGYKIRLFFESKLAAKEYPDQTWNPNTRLDEVFDAASQVPVILDFEKAVSGVSNLFTAAVENHLRAFLDHKPVLFLSGGWDSRAIAAVLTKLLGPQGFKVYTTSYDAGNDREERFAEGVARVLGLDHRIIPLPDDYYRRYALESFVASDFATDMHVWMAAFLDQLQLDDKTLLFDGYGGDVLLRGLLQEEGDDHRSHNDEVFFRRFAKVSLKTVLSNPVYLTLEAQARRVLAEELSNHPANRRILRYLFANRGANGVLHSVRLQRRHAEVALPFVDPELVGFVSSIDDSIRLRPDFYPAILARLDERLAGLPSTNDKDVKIGWSRCPVKKHSPENLAWWYSNIETAAEHPDGSGGVIDWFSIAPERIALQELSAAGHAKHLRALEMLNCYAMWLNANRGTVKPANVLEAVHQSACNRPWRFPAVIVDTHGGEIAQRYLAKAQACAQDSLLDFHFTMDVEAFPVGDAYAYHTASTQLVERLIYGDFGLGSDIERLLHANAVPCTYFFEAFSPVWGGDESRFGDAARFFARPFSEVGLHCHTFSIPKSLCAQLGLSAGWVLQVDKLAKALTWGKRRLESAIGRMVAAYRSGRLDIYPHMNDALAMAGILIDSSRVDGRTMHYYCNDSAAIGNGAHRTSAGVLGIPLTSYRVNDRARVLDINGSSFEDLCAVVVHALELRLPMLTMLMHSWSFSSAHEYPGLGKRFHYASSPAMYEKFLRFLDFLRQLPQVRLATLSETVINRKEAELTQFFDAAAMNLTPPPLVVELSYHDDAVQATAKLRDGFFPGSVQFAFYLLVAGEKAQVVPYSQKPAVRFKRPTGTSGKLVQVRAFVREKANRDNKIARSVTVSRWCE